MIRMRVPTVGRDGFFIEADEAVPPAWITQFPDWMREQLASDSAYDDGEPLQAEFPAATRPQTVPASLATAPVPPIVGSVPTSADPATGVTPSGTVVDASATLQQRRNVRS